ncbi:hypothetical protein GJ496_006413 [Pomphorhynchus laevis]|nr:hypothetical protein GJ496_006413 [Pomphorhynchus laevis]
MRRIKWNVNKWILVFLPISMIRAISTLTTQITILQSLFIIFANSAYILGLSCSHSRHQEDSICAGFTLLSTNRSSNEQDFYNAELRPAIWFNFASKDVSSHFNSKAILMMRIDSDSSNLVHTLMHFSQSNFNLSYLIMVDEDRKIHSKDFTNHINLTTSFDILTIRTSDLNYIKQCRILKVFKYRQYATFEPATILLCIIAVLTLIIGSTWGGNEYYQKRLVIAEESRNTIVHLNNLNEDQPYTDNKKSNNMPLVILAIFSWSVWIIMTYYFLQIMVFGLICVTAVISVLCINKCLCALFCFICRRQSKTFCTISKFKIDVVQLLIIPPSLGLVLLWFTYRKQEYGWILVDILTISICIVGLLKITFVSLKQIISILIIFTLFDVFFVIISPFIGIFQKTAFRSTVADTSKDMTKIYHEMKLCNINKLPSYEYPADGTVANVMEYIMFGISIYESIPVLIQMPALRKPTIPCIECLPNVAIGVGDILLPGLLLKYSRISDLIYGVKRYQISATIGYIIGFFSTVLVLTLLHSSQPALLYLTPCCLVSILLTSFLNGNLKEMLKGRLTVKLGEEKDGFV